MRTAMDTQKAAVDSGHWPLYRYNPDLAKDGKNPLTLDSKDPKISYEDFAYMQNRFRMLKKSKPERAQQLAELGQQEVTSRWHLYRQMESLDYGAAD
jgi:pyruvate-ferredoxin/flavodoxin oxidoreductase